nr:unnamed protein product [Callosobruchus analis]
MFSPFAARKCSGKMGISNIHSDNFMVTKNNRVCERHFAQDGIFWISSYYVKSTGRALTVPLLPPRLKSVAVTTRVPNCPQNLSKNITHRKSRDERLLSC